MSNTKVLSTTAGLTIAAFFSLHAAEASNNKGGVLPPFAYIQFCVHHASACNDTKGRLTTVAGSKVQMNAKLERQLADVNFAVNSTIHPKARGPGDPWTAGGKFGDCNSYALTKRAKLINAGWPSRALSLTVVKTAWGEGHLVLSVHTSNGIVVLDNLSHTVRPLSQVPYHLVAMQGGSALQWSSRIDNVGNTASGNLHQAQQANALVSSRAPTIRKKLPVQRHSVDVAELATPRAMSGTVKPLSEIPYRLVVLQSEASMKWNRRYDL